MTSLAYFNQVQSMWADVIELSKSNFWINRSEPVISYVREALFVVTSVSKWLFFLRRGGVLYIRGTRQTADFYIFLSCSTVNCKSQHICVCVKLQSPSSTEAWSYTD